MNRREDSGPYGYEEIGVRLLTLGTTWVEMIWKDEAN